MHIAKIFGLQAEPGRELAWVLGLIPFACIIGIYIMASDARLAENASDKILPSFFQMGDTMWQMAFTPDVRTGGYLFWMDTWASLTRLFEGIMLSAFVGLFLGVNLGLFPGMRAILMPVITALANVPPLALLPILFITFGVEELSKVILIFGGTVFVITRDIALATDALPREQKIKALTLGASELGVVYRVIVPQILPRLLTSVRLTLGSAWLFVIASEAIASSDGLGYRIFLLRRYLAMDAILPYVAWITLLAFAIDWALRTYVRFVYPWYNQN